MRLVDADALKEKAFFHEIDNVSYVEEEDIDNAPTVDAVEWKRGRWIRKDDSCCSPFDRFDRYVCSVCGLGYRWCSATSANFCPNCGAEMRGEENEDNDK